MGRSKESTDKMKARKQNWACVAYPTKDFYEKYMLKWGLFGSVDDNGKYYDEDGKKLYDPDLVEPENQWGLFDENDLNILLDSCLQVLISPLHFHDYDPDGNIKKPHFHIMVCYDNVKAYETQVKPFFDSFHGVGGIGVESKRGTARYMCHLDHPHKWQYDESLVIQSGGIDYLSTINLPTDDLNTLTEIYKYITDNHIFSFSQFMRICMKDYPKWYTLINCSKAYVVDKYIKGYAWECLNIDQISLMKSNADRIEELKES